MSKLRLLILTITFLLNLNLIYAQFNITHFLYPGVNSINRLYHAPYATIPPIIDGVANDKAWEAAEWGMAQINTKIATDWGTINPPLPEGSFQGTSDYKLQYKIVWDSTTYTMLLRIEDDVIVYSDHHAGYSGEQVIYPFAKENYGRTVWNQIKPAVGGGTGKSFDAWRMDNLHIFMTWNNSLYEKSGNYVRGRDGIYHNVFPGAWKTTRPDTAKIVANKQNFTPARYNPQAAITHNGTITYIEIKDTIWSQIISNRPTFGPVAKDTLLLNMQINDADGITNRRDYQLFLSTTEGDGWLTTKDWVKVVLKGKVTTDVPKQIKGNRGWFYPNPNNSGKLTLSEPGEISIYNIQGELLVNACHVKAVNISHLKTGLYIVKNKSGQVQKLQIF